MLSRLRANSPCVPTAIPSSPDALTLFPSPRLRRPQAEASAGAAKLPWPDAVAYTPRATPEPALALLSGPIAIAFPAEAAAPHPMAVLSCCEAAALFPRAMVRTLDAEADEPPAQPSSPFADAVCGVSVKEDDEES